MVAPDIRALFSHGPAQGHPPLASSPPRWPEQHSRQLTSIPGSSSGMTATTRSVPSFTPSQPSSTHPGQNQQQQGQSPSFNRLTSLPIDPWGSPGKQQAQVMQAPSTPGYTGSIGQFRTPPPGIGSVGANNAFYSPSGGQSQQNVIFSPEGPYGGAMSFQTPGSTVSSNHLYSNNNSPVQGVSSNVGNFASMINQHQTPHHQPSPQRPYSGSSGSRDNLQFLDEKLGSNPVFGPGYGPALNSGNNNNRYQQQQTNGQGYQGSSAFGQSLQYPQQRQRHSSHNSTTSHHTMFLGPIGGGLGSTGGSVNSDDISTEDESDEPFDEMRNRYHRSYHHTPQYQPSSQQQQQGSHGGVGGGGMFGSQTSMSSVLANRRGSVPSMGSMYSNQLLYRPSSPQHHPHQHYQLHRQQAVTPPPPHNVVRLSNSTSDLYGRKSLVSTMARHTLNDTTSTSGTNTGNNSGFNSPSRGTPVSGSGAPGSLAGFSPGFGANGNGNHERDLFSSGLGGIIGGGTISHSHSHGQSSPFNHHTHTNLASQITGSNGGCQQSSNAYDFINGGGIGSGVGALGGELVGGGSGGSGGGHVVGSSVLMGSTLSASALPFLAESALDRSGHHQQQQQQQQQRMVGGWDR